jgi:hypothetical protein
MWLVALRSSLTLSDHLTTATDIRSTRVDVYLFALLARLASVTRFGSTGPGGKKSKVGASERALANFM